jgi:GNAT superfamily N-acetyltransferase
MAASYKPMVGSTIEYRRLELEDLALIRDIDRAERIDAVYVQRGTQLELRTGDFSAQAWDPAGVGEHSVAAQRAWLERWVTAGSVALGAFDGDRLVGIGVVTPHVRPDLAQLAYLYVSDGYRASGIGSRLTDELEWVAREAGDTAIVVSATPSLNTVRFYQRRGFEPMAEPLPELYEAEPDDVHMQKAL